MFNYNKDNVIDKQYEQEIDMLLLILVQLVGHEGEINMEQYNNTIHDMWKVVTTIEYEGKVVYGEFHARELPKAIRMSVINLLEAIVHHKHTGNLNICNIQE